MRQPPWLGPPWNVLGAAVPLRLLLAHTPELAIAITDATAFPTGCSLTLALRLREAAEGPFDPLGHEFMGELYGPRRGAPSGELPPELFRFGVQFADGRKATTLGGLQVGAGEDAPQSPLLLPCGGGGGGHEWDQRYWLWPLPPPGQLALVCEWPARGIPLTRSEIDASLILEAASEAETLWELREGSPGEGVHWLR